MRRGGPSGYGAPTCSGDGTVDRRAGDGETLLDEGVEAAEPHLDLVGAELFDGLRVAIGEVAFPAQPVGAGGVSQPDTGAEHGQWNVPG